MSYLWNDKSNKELRKFSWLNDLPGDTCFSGYSSMRSMLIIFKVEEVTYFIKMIKSKLKKSNLKEIY